MNGHGWLRPIPVAIALSVQLACSSSGPPPQPNLSPTAVEAVTPAADVQAAHRLEVRVTISSATAVQGAGVAFRAFPRAAYDAHDENIESYVLGGASFDVPAGGGTFTALLEVPYEAPAGEYYVVPEVDPLDTIVETDEKDQSGVRVALQVHDVERDHPRLMIEDAVLDVPAFELSWALGAAPPPLGLTLLVRAEGNAAVPVTGAEITACASAPRTSCVALPLGIWDSEAGRHVPRLSVPELLPGEPTSVHLDLQFDAGLATVFESLMTQVATSCRANVSTCVQEYGANLSCAEECLAPVVADPLRADVLALQRCLLPCLPFTITATIGHPSQTLFEPTVAEPGRSRATQLRLLPPPPVSPLAPAVITLKALQEPVVVPSYSTLFGEWRWDPMLIEFAADKGSCTGPVTWTAALVPGQPPGTYASAGTLVGLSDSLATYWPPTPSDQNARTTKVAVEAKACGSTASVVVTLDGRDPSVALAPDRLEVEVGGDGTTEVRATVSDCTVDPQLGWTLEDGGGARLTGGPGTLESTGDPLVVRYRPPVTMADGPPVPVTLRASVHAAPCYADATATIEVGHPKSLSFEKGYAKEFANDLFGAGVDLYAGAFLDRDGGRADAHARIPVKVFGTSFKLLDLTDHASVDPRKSSASHFTHQIDVFGLTVDSLTCPGNPACSGNATLWSDQKCKPGLPQTCLGTGYVKPCTKSTECGAGLRCMNKLCTKHCSEPADCPGGICSGSIPASPYKKVFVIVVVPVTIEGQVCADYGIDARFNLLTPTANVFSATLNPYFELGGYASAAVGVSGLLALGVRGEIVLVRDDFLATVAAEIRLLPQGLDCPYAAGCIQGRLNESVENDLQGGKGKVFLFADYPTLKWCKWYPCIRTARASKTLASWGPLFQVANYCNWCDTSAQCGSATCVPAPGGTGHVCDDGYPGWLCREQHVFVSAE